LEVETNKYCPGGYDFGAISNLITWVLNFFLSAGKPYPHHKRHEMPRNHAMTWQHLQAGQEGYFRSVDTRRPCLRLPSLQPAQVTQHLKGLCKATLWSFLH
jgi:hypothetical protein